MPTALLTLTVLCLVTTAAAVRGTATAPKAAPVTPKMSTQTVRAKAKTVAAPPRFSSPPVITPRRNAPPHTAFEFNGKTYYRSLLPERSLVPTGPSLVQTITPDGTVITTVVPAPAAKPAPTQPKRGTVNLP